MPGRTALTIVLAAGDSEGTTSAAVMTALAAGTLMANLLYGPGRHPLPAAGMEAVSRYRVAVTGATALAPLVAVGGIAALTDLELRAQLAEAAAPQRPFASLTDLHAAMMRAVHAAAPDLQLAFLNGHPELAGPEARARSLTDDSASEQGSAGLDRMAEAEAAEFARLNAAYRARFGFPFIIAVKGLDRAGIIEAFVRRSGNSPEAEAVQALRQVGRITGLRLAALVQD